MSHMVSSVLWKDPTLAPVRPLWSLGDHSVPNEGTWQMHLLSSQESVRSGLRDKETFYGAGRWHPWLSTSRRGRGAGQCPWPSRAGDREGLLASPVVLEDTLSLEPHLSSHNYLRLLESVEGVGGTVRQQMQGF